jgi:type IV secretion system protein VirB10
VRRGTDAKSGLPGERGTPAVARTLSLQARISNLLAMILLLAIGLGFLIWYYAHVVTRSARVRRTSQVDLIQAARAEMPLPSLGNIDDLEAPPPAVGPAPAVASTPVSVLPTPAPMLVEPGPTSVPVPAPTQPTALERRLSGAAFTSEAGSSPGVESSLPSPPTSGSGSPAQSGAGSQEALTALLTNADMRPAAATILATQRLLLPKGAFIDCTLETAIDSTLPGLTTCVTATDTFGADGKVVLLERGTKLIGETRGQVQQASARVFVLWTEARTPTGVIVPLDSPGADELGRSGLPGEVDRHFWDRFGAAILISTIDGAVQAAVQATNHGSGTVIYNPSGAQNVLGEVLKSTLSIAPSVIKHNGDRIQVLVARDLDFSRVYELRHAR